MMQILQGVEQATLIHFDFIGNYGNLSKRERSVLEKQNVKLSKYLGRLPWKFNFYIDTKPLMENRTANDPQIYSKIPNKYKGLIKKDSSAINLVYGTVIFAAVENVHAPTPWILLHRLCHALFDDDDFVMFDDLIVLIKKLYGADIYKYQYDDSDSKHIINALFTFGSARRKTSLDLTEGLLDFYTQILVNGMKADMVGSNP